MCNSLIQYIDKLLKDEKIDSEIIELASSFCNNFQSPYSTVCQTLVTSYGPTIISFIDQGITTSGICEKFGLCQATLKKRSPRFPGRIQLPKTSLYQNSIGCDLCKNVVQYIETLLKDQTVEEEISQLVEKLCDTFPSPYKNICESLVEQYLPVIIKFIEEGLEVVDICNTIGLCQARLRKAVRIPTPIQIPQNYNNGIGCGLCTKVVLYVEELLKDQKIEEEIATLVAQLCQQFPSPYSTLCDSLVEQYIPMIIEWIEKGIEAADICTKIGLCQTQLRTKKAHLRTIQGKIALPSPRIYDNSIGCDMCTKVVQYIEQLMKDDKIEEEIAELVAQLCTNFPAPYSTLCSTLVESFIPIIMKLLESGVEYLDICTKIGLCTETQQRQMKAIKISASQTLNKVNQVYSTQVNGEVACEECKKWYQWVQTKFHDISIEGLWKFISEDCPNVPYLKYFCQIINEDNIHRIFDLIVSATPPEKACVWINLCPAE